MEIDESTTQVILIHPTDNSRVAVVRYQQGQAKTMQQALSGSLPVTFLITHPQQFTGKWHHRFFDPDRSAQGGTDTNLSIVYVVTPGF